MHSSQLPSVPSQPAQPPLPPAVAVSTLPPLPPGPSPSSDPQATVTHVNHGSRQVNNSHSSKKRPTTQTAYLPTYTSLPSNSARQCIESAQDRYEVELPYSSPFSFQDDQLSHIYSQHSGFEYPYSAPPQTSDAYIQGFPYFSYSNTHPPMSVPPPLFSVPQANFSFPPPLIKQPTTSIEPHLKIGIPFPPPGYDSILNSIKKESSSHDIADKKSSRDSRPVSKSKRSRSKSPSHVSTKPSSRHCRSANLRRRSRSRSRSRRRSHSRSRIDAHSRCKDVMNRQSKSKTHRKRSKTPQRIARKSRSASRSSRRSRSNSHSRRRSRSPSRIHRHSRSSSRAFRRSRSPTTNHKWGRQESRSSIRSRSTNRSPKAAVKKELDNQDVSSRIGTPNRSVKTEDMSSLNSAKDEEDDYRRNDDKNSDRSAGSLSSRKSFDHSPSNKKIEMRKITETLLPRKNGESYPSSHRERSKSERESLVERWRLNNCKNLEEMADKLDVLSKMEADEIIELEKQTWTRSAPADLYYKRHPHHPNLMAATPKLLELCEQFDSELVQRAECEREKFPAHQPPPRKAKFKMCRHTKEGNSSSSSSCEESSSDEEDKAMMELERKRKHPQRLHTELWHNEPGEMNDGPLCRCSHRASQSGIRHNVYVGEQKLEKCSINTNNSGKLYHYRITMSPPVNFLTKTPTIIEHDSHEYIFEGFSMLSHFPLVKLPTCKVIRFNIEYTILYVDEAMPENFTIRELDLFYNYLFHEVLELLDLDLRAFGDPGGCNQFHFMPRFVRDLPENGKEILSMNEVLKYLLKSNKPLVPEDRLNEIYNMSLYDWQTFADEVKCMVVTKPGMKPCALRVDQLDRETMDEGRFPEIVHFGIRPPQLSYAGNTEYQKHWREYVKFRHLLANMPKPSPEDKRKLMGKENRLQEMRTVSKMKRDVTIALSSQGFYRTGIMCDIIQHALLLPVLVCHLRFHKSLDQLEEDMDYKFKNRYLLQLALTHPSYRENFGTNPDHARNSLTNCGIRQPEYGDRRIHYMNTRKRGINTLIQIMSRFGKKEATESNIGHNERLEFLGDAVVEFITSIHLFHLFPDLEEGGLATYRAAIVQNQHLAVMAKRLNLDAYMLYAHGSDLCHDLELRHAMANCFEALMGALFLDGGIEVADKVFGFTLWKEQVNLSDVWMSYPLHPLQEQEPAGDRQWIEHFPVLQKLTEFEKRSGITFKHIRLLARAFTDRSVGYTNLTLGSNQRLEFLGDTVLQIIASEYLYKFFPEHHEGHLSLLRSSLVNNRTQAVVCDDLGMTEFALYANPKHDIKTKDRADLLEAYLGALYIDKGLKHCHLFCEVCFFPRLQDFIMNQDWNDPKSKLQQCCLTLRTMEGGEPDIPVYKVIQCMGPTNTRIYTVAVYFRGERLAQASGHSIQQAEMNAANEALELSTELFPQLDHQRRVIAKSMKKQKKRARREAALKAARDLEMRELEAKYRDQERNRDRERNRDKGKEGDRDKGRERNREKDRGRDQGKGRERDQDKGRERNRDNDRHRDRDRDQKKDREERNKDKERNQDKGRERDRERETERSCRTHDRRDCRSSHRTDDKNKDIKRYCSRNQDPKIRGSREREIRIKDREHRARESIRDGDNSWERDGSYRTERGFKDERRVNGDSKGSKELNLEFSGRRVRHQCDSSERDRISLKVHPNSTGRREKMSKNIEEDEDRQSSEGLDDVDIKWSRSPEAKCLRSLSSGSSGSSRSSGRSSPAAYSSHKRQSFSDTDNSSSSSLSSSRSGSVDRMDDLAVDIGDQGSCDDTLAINKYSFQEETMQMEHNQLLEGDNEEIHSECDNVEQTTSDEESNNE